ncbi:MULTISPECIES: glutathione binding-like protein [Henriciella]|jgi:glutathione S-transferase|uniref:Glutathione S-transferase n=1 Tax=Henriciella pelagia TaxID=1977912 RepID=A0ABQ1JUD7_9PROT|nr:glutathione binding-like protein [Henriciella pelagia]GGB77917.1 glutathione S-transferase [Henriciella pelagia]
MKLYYMPGACSMSSHIILNEIGADAALEKADTKNGVTASGEDYSKINPRGYVPALKLDSGDVLTENIAILTYLGEGHETLLPSSGLARARVIEMLSFLGSELHKAFGPFFRGSAGDADKETLNTKLSQLEAWLGDRAYLTGVDFTVADAYAFVILNWTGFIKQPLDAWPKLMAYHAKIGARPSVIKALRAEGLVPA